jgi:transcriptional regulator with XRE-family HTH domain
MDFWEKLEHAVRLRGASKQEVSAAAGLAETAISNYISKRQMPRADAAYKIAKELRVQLEWLLDDSAGWPPPDPRAEAASSLRSASYRELLEEVAVRVRQAAKDRARWVEEAEKIDWEGVGREAEESYRSGSPRSPAVNEALTILAHIQAPLYTWDDLAFFLKYDRDYPFGGDPKADRDIIKALQEKTAAIEQSQGFQQLLAVKLEAQLKGRAARHGIPMMPPPEEPRKPSSKPDQTDPPPHRKIRK